MAMSLLLGQFEGGLQEMPPGLIAALAVFLFIVIAVGLVIGVVICYLLYSCFERIPSQHRQMESWQAFLLLIPCFNIVWNFFVLPKLARSYQGYFAEQGRTDVGDCGDQIGLWCAICAAVSGVFFCVRLVGPWAGRAGLVLFISWVPRVGYLAGLAGLVLGIIYLVKVLTLKGQIPPQQTA